MDTSVLAFAEIVTAIEGQTNHSTINGPRLLRSLFTLGGASNSVQDVCQPGTQIAQCL